MESPRAHDAAMSGVVRCVCGRRTIRTNTPWFSEALSWKEHQSSSALSLTTVIHRSAELIILSIVEPRARHGYEISKLIETQSAGQLKFHVASLYPLLYRLEERGWLHGRWVEKPGQRRRRFYSLTSEGRRVLARQRDTWKTFVHAMGLITGVDHA